MTVQSLPGKSQVTARSSFTPMRMAAQTLGSPSPLICRAIPGKNVNFKWMEAFPMNMSTSSATIEKLRITFAPHGLPDIVVTDNGSNFVSREFEDFLKQNGIRHIRIALYHPASNRMAERAVQTFKKGMTKMNGGSVETRVPRFLVRHRITP